jgi:hypothetical protein
MTNISDRQSGIQFDSADIAKKESTDYFSVRVKENKFKNLIKLAFEGKHRFVTTGICAAILILAVILILWLTVWSKAPNSNQSGTTENPWTQELVNINSEAYGILGNPGLDSAYFDAIEYYDNQIKTIENEGHQFDLIIARANFMTFNGGATSAIISISDVDEISLTDEQKYQLYLALRAAYQDLEQESAVQDYTDKINALPKNITTQGGPADE